MGSTVKVSPAPSLQNQPAHNGAILLFLVIALGFSACYWAMLFLFPKGTLPSQLELILWAILRGFGPAIAALIAAYYKYRLAGIKILLSKLGRWRVSPWLYLLAFAWPLLTVAAAVLAAHFAAGVSLFPAAGFTPKLILVFFAMAIVDGPLGEEIGWRGFLLPELLRKIHPVFAGLIVGCIWWAWHIPLYMADGRGGNWLPYLFQTTALSLVMTWFFLRTRESIFFAIFLHNCTNYPIFLSWQLFPTFRGTTIGRYVLLGIFVLAGIAASISMMRQKTQITTADPRYRDSSFSGGA